VSALPEMVNISRAELDKLRERAKRLALEKSYLQLVVDLIDRLGSTAGLENAVESMARLVCDTIGGSNVVIHYRIDDEFESVDAYGKARTSGTIDDEMAAEAFETRRAIEAAHAFQDTKMLTPEFTKAYALAVPLLVGEEVVGVLKVDDMMMPAREAEEELRAFFTYAALVLKNEIHNYTRLSRAYDELSASNAFLTDEIGQRKKAEKQLRDSKRQLEAKVRERTRVLRTLSESNQTLMHASDEGELLRDVCRVAVEIGGYPLAWVGFVEHDQEKSIRPVAWAGDDGGYVEHIQMSWGTGPTGQGPSGRSVRQRKPVAVRDIRTDPRYEPWRVEALQRGYRSSISLPLLDSDGTAFGTIAIYAEKPDAFDAAERALLTELTGDLAYGIEALRERQKRAEAEEGVREAASYARSIIEAAPDALIAISPDGKITDVNEAAEHETGIPRDRLIGSDFTSHLTEPDEARAGFQNVLEKGVVRDFPLTLKRASGETRDVLYSGTVYRDAAGEPRGVLVAAHDVTEAKKAQAQVARLAAIVTSSQDAIFTKDLDDVVTSWNAAAEALYGYSAQEMIGTDVGVLTPPGREGEPRQLVERVRQGERISGFETQRKRKDGSLVDVSLTLSSIRDDAGNIVAVSVIGHDITERKRAEREVRESEEKFAAAFSGSPDLLSITRISDGTILEVNEGYERLLGYARAESVGKTTDELSIWADPAGRTEFIRRLTESGEVTDFETTLRRKDGTLVPVIDSARTFDLQGEACVLSVVHDITERKRAEGALQKSEERLRLEVSRMPIAYIVWDNEFRVVTWNPAAEAIFGFTFDEAKGRHPYEMIVPPEAQPQVDDIWSRLLAGDASAHSVNQNTTKDGRTIICDWTNTPLKQPDGTVLGVMSMVQDITERKRAEDALRKRNEELERFERVVVGRELRMKELKDRIAELEEALAGRGENPRES